MITPILKSERVLLRPLKVSDAQIIYNNWTSDPDVAEFMRWSTHSSVNDTITWLTYEEAKIPDSDLYDWLFVLKETDEPFGSGGLFFNSTHNMFELGYCITYRLNQNKFFACHANDNPASGRILEKLGFVYKNNAQYSKFDGSRTYESREYFFQHKEGSQAYANNHPFHN